LSDGTRILVAPTLGGHGMVCRIDFASESRLCWQFGGVWWHPAEKNDNRCALTANSVCITEGNLPNGEAWAGWSVEGEGRLRKENYGQGAEFTARRPQRTYHVAATWGVRTVDAGEVQRTLARLDTSASAGWPQGRDLLKRQWEECFIAPALDPEGRLRSLLADPDLALRQTCEQWDRRRNEFQIKTPDPHLNALINWARCTSEYHRQGPGLFLGHDKWQMYAHISVGWYGNE
jgi:hypothetical protein